ncbi:hypothetical protein G3I32_15880 [Streptomyces coelicoflavus]|uniref:Uncharacterized protein n=1 Tax=Streptomyces coelicoflavus TaxID=285562 RepID=A0A7K3PN02_9ACTN|nr:hypothetical protein [Streptomyces coelicoflavus]NEB10315.1 hypothetical protein [Streptomyces coelicoflavus]
MSVNIRVELDVSGLSSREQAEETRRAVQQVVNDEGIQHEVAVPTRERDEKFVVLGRTGAFPVVVSGVSRWQPEFQARVEAAVGRVTSTAKVRLFCADADLERALEEGTL